VQSFQSVDVLLLLVTEREASLRNPLTEVRGGPTPRIRRILGRQLVSLGAWLAAEPAAIPAWA
jgi:hypothetical protein